MMRQTCWNAILMMEIVVDLTSLQLIVLSVNVQKLSFLPLVISFPNNFEFELMLTFDFQKTDCTIPQWIGDGYCDDVINTEVCNYDSGDCCGSSIDTTYCIECQCCDIGGCNATINGGNGGNNIESLFN